MTEGDTPPALGSPEANGHEFSYSCQGNRIYFLYNHMPCDGHGYAMVDDTVIRSYCRLRYGVSLDGGLVSMDETPTGEEYADPYAYARMPEPPIPHFAIPQAFMPPEEDMRRDGAALIRRIRAPKEDVFRLRRALEGSPATLAALLLIHPLGTTGVWLAFPIAEALTLVTAFVFVLLRGGPPGEPPEAVLYAPGGFRRPGGRQALRVHRQQHGRSHGDGPQRL